VRSNLVDLGAADWMGIDRMLAAMTMEARSYLGVASRLVPNRLHRKVLSRVQRGRKEEDVFPTLYRCNTPGALRRLLNDTGFDSVVYGYDAEPSYLQFSTAAYALGVVHQKFAPGFLKISIFAFAQKRTV